MGDYLRLVEDTLTEMRGSGYGPKGNLPYWKKAKKHEALAKQAKVETRRAKQFPKEEEKEPVEESDTGHEPKLTRNQDYLARTLNKYDSHPRSRVVDPRVAEREAMAAERDHPDTSPERKKELHKKLTGI